jgi:tetratricopeptide (TPR) repeat protein
VPSHWNLPIVYYQQKGKSAFMNSQIHSRAKASLRNGNYSKALHLYRELIISEPNNALVYQNLAIALGELGDHNEALVMSNKALEIDPNLIIPHITKAYIFNEIGEKDKSRKEVAIALNKNPESHEALCCSGVLSIIDNRLDDALQDLLKAIKINPSFYLAHYNLAAIYQIKNDPRNLFQQTIILFKLKPTMKNLLRMIFVLSRWYRSAHFPVLLLAVAFSFLFGANFILIFAIILMIVWVLGGIYIGFMAERKQINQLVRNMITGLGIGLFGLAIYLSLKYFLGR